MTYYTVVPSDLYSGIGETSNSIQFSPPSYDESTSIIPLQTAVNEVVINPPVDIEVDALNLTLDPFSTHFIDFQIDADVAVRSVPSILVSSDKIQIFGMNYADKHWRRIPVPNDEAVSPSKIQKIKKPGKWFCQPPKFSTSHK